MEEKERELLDKIDNHYKEAPDYPLNLIQDVFGVKPNEFQIIDAEKQNENMRELEEYVAMGTIEGDVYQCLFVENRGLYETAGYLSISAKWVDAISRRTLIKLRHPARSKLLKEFIKFN